MSNADKNIKITPNTGQVTKPTIDFVGGNNTPITMSVDDDGSLNFRSSTGSLLFNITNDTGPSVSNSIWAASDRSGLPVIEITSSSALKLTEFGGGLTIGGTTTPSATTIYGNTGINGTLSVSGATSLTSDLSISAASRLTTNKILLNRSACASSGIAFCSSGYTPWQLYMANGSSGNGIFGNITSPVGSIVTSWAQRSVVENVAGYGWIWESGATTSAPNVMIPSIVAEMSSVNGDFRTIGNVCVAAGKNFIADGNKTVLHTGNYNTCAPSLAGSGATGTWNINISGGAGSVGWANVTGTPTCLMCSGVSNYTLYPSVTSVSPNDAPIVLREKNLLTTSTTDIKDSPRIGFHWGGTAWMNLALRTDGYLGLYSSNYTAFTPLLASDVKIGTPTTCYSVWHKGCNVDAATLGGNSASYFSVSGHTHANLTFNGPLVGSTYNGGSAVSVGINATSLNSGNFVVQRDASGNFSAGTITATLAGNASSASTLQNPITINGVGFNAGENKIITAAASSITTSVLGSGPASATTYLNGLQQWVTLPAQLPTSTFTVNSRVLVSGGSGSMPQYATTESIIGSYSGSCLYAGQITSKAAWFACNTASTPHADAFYPVVKQYTTYNSGSYTSATASFGLKDCSDGSQAAAVHLGANGAGGSPNDSWEFLQGGHFKLTGNVCASSFCGSLVGNAATASSAARLTTPRMINLCNFDGTAPITITANTPNSVSTGSYMCGGSFNGSGAATFGVCACTNSIANSVVARDVSGNFSAGTITATLAGNASSATKVNNSLSAGTFLCYEVGSAFDGSAATTIRANACSSNVGSTLVHRDTLGNFSANVISANTMCATSMCATCFYGDATLSAGSRSLFAYNPTAGTPIDQFYLPLAGAPTAAICSYNNTYLTSLQYTCSTNTINANVSGSAASAATIPLVGSGDLGVYGVALVSTGSGCSYVFNDAGLQYNAATNHLTTTTISASTINAGNFFVGTRPVASIRSGLYAFTNGSTQSVAQFFGGLSLYGQWKTIVVTFHKLSLYHPSYNNHITVDVKLARSDGLTFATVNGKIDILGFGGISTSPHAKIHTTIGAGDEGSGTITFRRITNTNYGTWETQSSSLSATAIGAGTFDFGATDNTEPYLIFATPSGYTFDNGTYMLEIFY